MTGLGLFYCLAAAFIWGTTPLAFRRWGREIPPAKLVMLRSLGFCIFGIGAGWWAGASIFIFRWELVLSVSCTMFGMSVADWLSATAINDIGTGKATAIGASYPVFTCLISVSLLNERLPLGAWSGIAMIFAGLAMLRPRYQDGSESTPQAMKRGFTLALIAAVFWSFSTVATKIAMNTGVITSAALIFWKSLGVLLASWTMWIVNRQKNHPSVPLLHTKPRPFVVLVVAGFLSLGFANVLASEAMIELPASLISPLTATSPVWASLSSMALFREAISRIQWLGILMVLCGGAVVNLV